MSYVLDACALMAFLSQETGKGFEPVKELFERALDENFPIYMSIVNLTEVYYLFMQKHGRTAADTIMENASGLPITVIDTISEAVYRQTAHFKSRYAMSLADAFACATAQTLGAVLVTKDSEMKEAEAKEALPILWIM
jgi:predicted nucleic acid-binding protein